MLSKRNFSVIITDIRFWLLLFFLIRLIGITNAPLEIGHNWRQSLTNMIARNFYEGEANILFPKIDMAGEKTGIIGSEFPFFNYLIYLTSLVFDYTHWYGRLINLTVSTVGIYYFYKLLRKLFNSSIAFNSSMVLLTSVWFSYSRKIMPDTFSVSLLIIGLYYCVDYIKSNEIKKLILFFLFSTIGILSKIPALSLLSILLVLAFTKEVKFNQKFSISIAALLSLIIVCAWYYYWVPSLINQFGFQLFFPKGVLEGIGEILPLITELLEKFYFSSLCSYFAFFCFLAGVVFIFRSKNNLIINGFIFSSLAFGAFIVKTGAVFPLHNYYIIPFTPVMSFVAGYFLANIQRKYCNILLVLISIEAISNQQHDFFIKDSEKYKLTLESITDQCIPKNALIVINGGQSPQLIYFAHRKGWTLDNKTIQEPGILDSLKNKGAKYLIINNNTLKTTFGFYPVVFKNSDFEVYKFTSPPI